MNSVDLLYNDLYKIGFRVSTESTSVATTTPDIERTLIKALYEVDNDGRLLSLILSWLSVHKSHVVADKFFKEYQQSCKFLGETPWFVGICAFITVCLKDHRFQKGVRKLDKPHHYGNRDQNSLIKLKGSVDFLEMFNIHMATSSLRIRVSDVLTCEELIKSNLQYRNRFIYGANWRAEIITAIQSGSDSPGKVAKSLGLARSRVGAVFKEYALVKTATAN